MKHNRRIRINRLVVTITAFLITTGVIAAAEVPGDFLRKLHPGHPRLMIDDERLTELKNLIESDATAAGYMADVLKQADSICEEPALSYEAREGYRLMFVARRCMERMYTLGLAWHLTGDDTYALTAERDLITVTSLENWTPSLSIIYPKEPKYERRERETGQVQYSFLDVSEMCHAVGIGYDWFWERLSPEARKRIRSGLIRNGLDPGVAAYTGKGEPGGKPHAWIYYDHNWNMVCNGGLIIGALSIADENPEYANIIIPHAVESLPRALKTYAPDGAWPEGPSYWGYATSYTVYGLAALESALGTDYGLSEFDGLDETGLFPLFTTGPTGLYLNYADSGERNRLSNIPCLFWLGKRYGSDFLIDQERRMAARDGIDPLHLVWYEQPQLQISSGLTLDKYFGGPVEVAVFRSGWNDPGALFAGIKAGDNTFNHAHLDLGTFEMDALGVRWARDPGSDDYSLPGYFDFWYLTKQRGGQRWNFYRNSSFSHNICVIGGENQDELAKASFTAFHSDGDGAHGVIDLTEAYSPGSRETLRGIRLVGGRKAILVQDEFELANPAEIAWGITTDADITVRGSSAVLRQDGKELRARIIEPAGAVFTVESAEQEPPQKRNEGVSRLMVRIPGKSGRERIAVLLSPVWNDGTVVERADIIPLESWEGRLR